MGFTKSQQGQFRPLVDLAWRTVATDPNDKAAKRTWYESELMACVGTTSTVPLDRGRDFEHAAAHFEVLADTGETTWQQRAEDGDCKRVLWSIFRGRPPVIGDQTITAAYLRGIAQQSLNLPSPPTLRTLSKAQLNRVIKALAIHAHRHQK